MFVAMVTVAMIFQEAGDETFLLSRYLGLYHAIEQAEMFSSALCVEWFCPDPPTHIKAWCQDLVNFVDKQPSVAKVRVTMVTQDNYQL